MRIISSVLEMHSLATLLRKSGESIVFVPTMGALHKGHLVLIKKARTLADIVVVSIFVNPTQFNDPKDFEKYPRTLSADLQACKRAGADIVFTPSADDIYGKKSPDLTHIWVPTVAKTLEGLTRPGHFQGVVTIVEKLFKIMEPHVAVFGLKDFQQVRVIEEMIRHKKMRVQIAPLPTVRTPEGLALSSRNARLSAHGKRRARLLSQSLKAAQRAYRRGETSAKKIKSIVLKKLSEDTSLKIDSVDIVDARTLKPVFTLRKPTLVALAVFVEGVRLIDNCVLES